MLQSKSLLVQDLVDRINICNDYLGIFNGEFNLDYSDVGKMPILKIEGREMSFYHAAKLADVLEENIYGKDKGGTA